MKKLIFRLFIMSMLVFSSVLILSCSNDMDKISAFVMNDTLPAESGKDVEYIYTENGIIKSKLTAKVFNRYEASENYIEIPEGFIIEMFDEFGEIQTQISGKYAIRYETKKMMEAKYNVVVFDAVENKTLNTEHLIWNEAEKKISTNKFVKITTPDKIIFGDGLEADENFNFYTIIQPKGEILINRKE